MRVAIVGAGITGLSAAVELRLRGAHVGVYEATDRVGGAISTVRREGFLIEAGPTSLATSAVLETLIDQVGIGAQCIGPLPTARRRFIVRDSALVALPGGPVAFLRTRALTARGKLAFLREPFVRARRDDADESLAALVRRRLGDEILEYLVDPIVSGIFAGDPERLSVRFGTPRLHRAERRHGSLILGALRDRHATAEPVRRASIVSFVDGLASLPQAMAATVADSIFLATPVTRLEPSGTRWTVHAQGRHAGSQAYDAVIVALPARALARVALPTQAAEALQPITRVTHAPLATLALGFRRADVAHPLDGFGFLTPAVERRAVLGALFSTSVFARRAPAEHVLITCFLGGLRAPELAALETAQVLPVALRELQDLVGARANPVLVHHQRWAHAIPQFELGHDAVLQAAAQIEGTLPGLGLAGPWREGASLGACIAQGQAAAIRVLAHR